MRELFRTRVVVTLEARTAVQSKLTRRSRRTTQLRILCLSFILATSENSLKDSGVVGGFIAVNEPMLSYFTVEIFVIVFMGLYSGFCGIGFKAEGNIKFAGLNTLNARIIFLIDAYFLQDEPSTKENVAFEAHYVSVGLLTEFIPSSVKVLNVDMNVRFSEMPRESHKRWKILIVTVKLIAILRGKVDAAVAEVNVSFIGIGVLIKLESTADKVVVVVIDSKVIVVEVVEAIVVGVIYV